MPRRKTTKSGKVYTKTTPKKPLTEAQKAALKKGTAAAKAKADAERAERERIAEEERLAEEKRIAELEAEERIKFRPNEGPQTEFLTAPEQEVLYGGAAGGGKTFALLLDVLHGIVYSDYVALILRRTTDELREIIQKSKEIYPIIDPSAKWHERKSEWSFGSGARIWMTFLDRDDDVHRYQGQAFSYIAFDELTHWPTPHAWNYLRSRLRTTNPNITPYMRATSNPGGPGHAWVKEMFVDPSPPGTPFWARDSETGEILREPALLGNKPNPRAGKPLFQRRFIPAKLLDNPYLAGTNYLQSLMSLPEEKRRALLDGDWTVAEGAAFPEFKYATHTCEPFDIDDGFKIFKACDYGYGSYSAVLWFAVAPSGQVFVVDEIYVSKVLARDLKDMIKERDRKWRSSYGVLDSSCWHKRGDSGPSIAEQLGFGWRPSDRSRGSRVSGKNIVHSYLAHDDFLDEPNLMIFRNCTNLIACMSSIPLDKNNPEDVDTDAEDHLYDALRYGLASRPKSRNLMEFANEGSFFNRPKPTSVFGHGY